MSNTVELRVDGERIVIEIESFSALERMVWAGKAPDSIKQGSNNRMDVTEDVVDFLINLTTSQTILTESLLQELPEKELTRLFNAVVTYSFDENAELSDRGAEQYRADNSQRVEWNEDGSIDLEDWR